MKVLVTGSAGFIGFHIVNLLVLEGYDVVGIDNLNEYYSLDLKNHRLESCGIEVVGMKYNELTNSSMFTNYRFIKLDITDYENLILLFQKERFNIVINLAAQAGVRFSIQNPNEYVRCNVTGFLSVLECCKAFPPEKILYASSSSIYGKNHRQPFSVNDKADTPINMYAVTKKTNELMAHCYSHLFSLKTIGLRFFTVYGPWGRPDMAPILFAKAIMNGEEIKMFNFGDMQRDFTYIDDIVNGIFHLLKSETNKNLYQLYNIGNNKPVDLMTFVGYLENELGKKAVTRFVEMQPGDLKTTWADTSELINDTGYTPTTNLEEGTHKFTEWFKEYYL